jgi:hypothetical protein
MGSGEPKRTAEVEIEKSSNPIHVHERMEVITRPESDSRTVVRIQLDTRENHDLCWIESGGNYA